MAISKRLKFYKDPYDNCWYLWIKYLPKFLTPLLQMVCGADRLLDILYMESKALITEDEVDQYYNNKLKEVYWITCTVDTHTKLNRVKDFRFSLKLNKYLNRELKMNHTRDGRMYILNTIDLYLNTEFLNNDQRKLFDNIGLGNNVWLCFVTWFIFRFSYPKKINVGEIKAYKYNMKDS